MYYIKKILQKYKLKLENHFIKSIMSFNVKKSFYQKLQIFKYNSMSNLVYF